MPDLTAKIAKISAASEQDYGELKKQVKEYDAIKKNIDCILCYEKELEKEHQTEYG